jgi:Pectate lyase superfamily protein
MNKAITDGLVLMPPPFSAGLALWSSANGVPGDASYQGQPNVALVSNDQDFAGCLELQKTATTQKLRSFAETPIQPGLYLRVTVRIKAVSGNLPSLRIAAWAGSGSTTNVGTVPQTGNAVALTSYGQVVTVQAIIGSGNRQGVDLVWGTTPILAHIGLDLTGANGGVVRIDDIVVEDVTEVFHRKMMDWIDVRDYGAIGNGVADDTAAFAAADIAAAGRSILVSAGTYFINGNLTLNSAVRFEGRLVMPDAYRLACTRNYDLDTYAAAFGGELAGFSKALQSLFYFTDHVEFNLSGRRVDLTAPLDIAAIAGLDTFSQRRVIRNGFINAVAGASWTTTDITSVATYSPTTAATTLTGVANVANVPIGALVLGTGVGREVYVKSKNIGAGTVELSQALYGAAGTRSYTFRRFRYMLDFSGFAQLTRFEIEAVELSSNGIASGLMLPLAGATFRIAGCTFNRPLDRAITSPGTGCQGLFVDQCQFLSNEQSQPAQTRTSIVLNVNANDTKLRNNRAVRFAHFAIMNGSGHLILGNHFFQGDDEVSGVRRAGLVFTQTNVSTVVSGNYVDNCSIEWGNEHDAAPEFESEFSFGGLNIVGNVFIASNVASFFRWIVIKPYGAGHFINGMSVTSNSFRVFNASADRVEAVDTTFAALDMTRTRNLRVEGNSFNQVGQTIMNPIPFSHTQNTAADPWTIDASAFFPFGGRVRMVEAVMPEGALTNAANANRYIMPNVTVGQGAQGNQASLRWGEAVKGKATVVLRIDSPT